MTKNCRYCLKAFPVKKSHFERRVCCSKKCQSELYKTILVGCKNPNYKGKDKIQFICKYCGVLFIPKAPYIETKACSKKCLSGLISNIHSGKKVLDTTILKQKKSLFKKFFHLKHKKICKCGKPKDVKSKTCRNCWTIFIKRKIKNVSHVIIYLNQKDLVKKLVVKNATLFLDLSFRLHN